MNNTYCLEKESSLFRYDLIEPPTEWSSTHRNIEYTGSVYGDKNAMSAFFFFNSEYQATETAKCAIKKVVDIQNPSIWITRCCPLEDMNLLDLRQFCTIIDLLSYLIEDGYNILSSQYKSFFNEGISFDRLKKMYLEIHDKIRGNALYYQDTQLMAEIIPISEQVEKFLNIDLRMPGQFIQLITDYSNGVYFIGELKSKGYEGIIFNETIWGHQSSDTICIFSASKLSSPKHYMI